MNTRANEQAALSVEQICSRYSVCKGTVFALLRENKLTRVKIGRRTVVPIASVEAWWQSIQKAG